MADPERTPLVPLDELEVFCNGLDHAEGNDRAHAFYERQGFVETHRHGPAGDREVRMARLLR